MEIWKSANKYELLILLYSNHYSQTDYLELTGRVVYRPSTVWSTIDTKFCTVYMESFANI